MKKILVYNNMTCSNFFCFSFLFSRKDMFLVDYCPSQYAIVAEEFMIKTRSLITVSGGGSGVCIAALIDKIDVLTCRHD
jgi:hypothetical protein